MKRIILVLVALVFLASPAWSVDYALKATWTPNTEDDIAGYNLYRTDGERVKINSTLIPHPPALPYNFIASAPDGQDYTMTFVCTAVDTAGNESLDSNTAPFYSNLKAPVAPGNLGISK